MTAPKESTNRMPDGYYNGKPYWINKAVLENWFGYYDRVSRLPNKEFRQFLDIEATALTIRRSCNYSPYGRHYMGGC